MSLVCRIVRGLLADGEIAIGSTVFDWGGVRREGKLVDRTSIAWRLWLLANWFRVHQPKATDAEIELAWRRQNIDYKTMDPLMESAYRSQEWERRPVVDNQGKTHWLNVRRVDRHIFLHALRSERSLIQALFPYLKSWERELLINGTGPDEWEELFGRWYRGPLKIGVIVKLRNRSLSSDPGKADYQYLPTEWLKTSGPRPVPAEVWVEACGPLGKVKGPAGMISWRGVERFRILGNGVQHD